MKNFYEEDKARVLEWMSVFCSGFRQARTRDKILPCMTFKRVFDNPESKDRYWRKIISELKHEKHIASTSYRGYWFVPLTTDDPAEIEAVLESCLETKSRALDQLTDCDRNIKYWQDRKLVIEQGQLEFVG